MGIVASKSRCRRVVHVSTSLIRLQRGALILLMLFLVGLGVGRLGAQAPSAPPVFTAAQAEAGRTAYQTTCASCHSGDLGGNGEAPELAGSSFMGSWRSQTTQDLFKYVQGMPPGGPHLAADEYVPIVAYILQQNGAAAGDQPFTVTTAASIGAIATGVRPGSR
jgi:mono/diheme cytochrome c family protein